MEKIYIEHTFPNGMKTTIDPDTLCECKKFILPGNAKVCMSCDRKGMKPFYKDEVKPKKSK